MRSDRLEAFSDAVIAIVITIMVLELAIPDEGSWEALRPLLPNFLSYVLSFAFLGIYWNNHHHLLRVVERVNGKILWANLHLLFWLSLTPFVTGWMGESFTSPTVATYGTVLLLAAIAYYILQTLIVRAHGHEFVLRAALGRDLKGKASLVLYVSAIPLAFVSRWTSVGIYVFVALIWLVPDRRIESIYEGEKDRAER